MPAEAGVANASRGAVKKLDAALTELDDAVLRFVGDTGCLPEALKDLTATASPARGLDSSGNVVPLAGAYRGPYLHRLPSDPLTRRNDTWVYEVTGAPMIESGAFATSVSYNTGPFIVPPRRRPGQ